MVIMWFMQQIFSTGLLDSGPAISGACFISTSTAKSDFDTTVPSWTNIEAAANANWMLSADVEAQSEIKTPVVKDYTVYRDGVEVKSGITGLTYTEELARYIYLYSCGKLCRWSFFKGFRFCYSYS